jgi:hypothetical protein
MFPTSGSPIRPLPRGQGGLALTLLALLGPPLLGALLASCGGDGDPAPPVRPDAGRACEPGAQGCACGESNACDRGLLCSVGRCLPTEGSSNEPDIRVPLPACASLPCDVGPSSS